MVRTALLFVLVALVSATAGYLGGARRAAETDRRSEPPVVERVFVDPKAATAEIRPALQAPPLPPSDPLPGDAPVQSALGAASAYPHPLTVVQERGELFLRLPNGLLKLVFRNDAYALVPHGPWRDWTPAGVVLQDGEYENGTKTGKWTVYHPDGTTASRTRYVNGRPDGELVRWHPNGRRAEVMYYVGGVLDGPAAAWHANGELASRGEWDKGEKTGWWLHFDEQGNLLRRERWQAGALAEPAESSDPGREWPTEESARERAAIGGKYADLAASLVAPEDRETYGEFHDYGWYPATDYLGHRGLPEGYWVYVYPYWFIWQELRAR